MIAAQNVAIYLALFLGISSFFCAVGYSTFVLVGSLAEQNYEPASYALVTYLTLGIAIVGFLCFIAGIAHALYWPSIAIPSAFICALGFSRLPIDTFSYRTLLARSLKMLRSAQYVPLLVAMIVAIPSVLPDTTSDGQSFHLLYAAEWAKSHAITVDPFIHQPFYAMNWLSLDALLDTMGLGWYAPVLSGLSYAWSAQAIFALTVRFLPKDLPTIARVSIPAAGTLSYIFAPVAIHWAFTGLIDAPMGLLFVATIMSAVSAVILKSRSRCIVFAIQAGFFVGMKTSLVLFVPLFLIIIIAISMQLGRSRREIAAMVALLITLSAPWYVRNFILDGDPIAPTLNLLLTGHDRFWDMRDLTGQLSDLPSSAKSLSGIASLPLDIVFRTSTSFFREYGAPYIDLLLFVPILAFIGYLTKRKSVRVNAFGIVMGSVSYAVVYYGYTSTLVRYQLVFCAAFSAAIGILFAQLVRLRVPFWVPTMVLIIGAVPSYSSYSWISANEQSVLDGLALSRDAFMDQRLDGYRAARYVAMHTSRRDGSNVYQVGAGNLCLTLFRQGIGCVGDWTGPARFEDLNIAIHYGEMSRYTERFLLSAFILRKGGQPISDVAVSMLGNQLIRRGFVLNEDIDEHYDIFLRDLGARR